MCWLPRFNGNSVTITDPDNRPREVSYFSYRSSLNPNAIDDRAPNTVYQFEFSLRLPHNSTLSFVNISLPSPSIVTNQSSMPTFNTTFSGLSDALLNQIIAKEMRDMLSAQRGSLSTPTPSTTSRSLKISTPYSSTTTVANTSTQKIGIFCFLSSVGFTYTRILDSLNNQSSFDNMF